MKFKSLLIFAILVSYVLSDDICTCPASAPVPQTIVDSYSSSASSSSKDVVIEGVNYGKLLSAGGLLLLENAVTCPRGINSLSAACPSGYRLPTKEEYETMLEKLGTDAYSVLKDNFVSGKSYITSTKVYPDIVDGTNGNAWAFYGLKLSGTSYQVNSVNTFFDGSTMFARCIMDLENVEFNIEGLAHDLIVGEDRTIILDTAPFLGFVWKFENSVYTENSITVNVNKKGCRLLQIWGKLLNGQESYSCLNVNANIKMGKDTKAEFNLDKVTVLPKTFSSPRTSAIHFSRPQAPIAPKTDGGYYMTFYDHNIGYCKVVDFDSNDNVLKEYTLSEQAYPLDVIETDKGLAIYFKSVSDSNYAYIVIYDAQLNQVSKTTIMNNGEGGVERNDSLIFYTSAGSPLYGSAYMYNPHNGKLAYGRDRVNLIFAHYNYFGENGGHTGDSYYSFDANGDVEKAKYSWSWQTSHSCIQSHIYDGTYFITAALGDYYPQGINLNIIDPAQGSGQYIQTTADQTICGKIMGNGKGSSLGKLGGVLDLGSQNYAVVYSVKKASSSDTNDGIFLATFNYTSKKITQIAKHNI